MTAGNYSVINGFRQAGLILPEDIPAGIDFAALYIVYLMAKRVADEGGRYMIAHPAKGRLRYLHQDGGEVKVHAKMVDDRLVVTERRTF